ncbi:hypothetical protein R6Q59_024216 [Mikania micrantha]
MISLYVISRGGLTIMKLFDWLELRLVVEIMLEIMPSSTLYPVLVNWEVKILSSPLVYPTSAVTYKLSPLAERKVVVLSELVAVAVAVAVAVVVDDGVVAVLLT